MSIRKKLVSLLGTTMIAAAIMFVAGGAPKYRLQAIRSPVQPVM